MPASARAYGLTAIAFHWVTALLVVIAFTLGPGGSEARVYSAAKDFDRELHELLGLAVFGLTLARLAWRAAHPAPELPGVPEWMRRAARLVQGLLYALLVVTPLTAVSGAWLEGHPLTLGVLGNVPPLLPKAHAAGRIVAEVHGWLGDALLWIAGAHAATALFHHFVLKDGVLLSMLRPR